MARIGSTAGTSWARRAPPPVARSVPISGPTTIERADQARRALTTNGMGERMGQAAPNHQDQIEDDPI